MRFRVQYTRCTRCVPCLCVFTSITIFNSTYKNIHNNTQVLYISVQHLNGQACFCEVYTSQGLGFIYSEQRRTRKCNFSLIFVAAQCKQQIKVLNNRSGSDVAFAIAQCKRTFVLKVTWEMICALTKQECLMNETLSQILL